jgi:hypothetical protein
MAEDSTQPPEATRFIAVESMSLEQARAILRNDRAQFVEWCEAAFRLCSIPGANYEDWLLCLSRRGLPAETAATKLYSVTKRPLGETIDSLILDSGDWREYLKSQKLIE